MLLAFLFWLIFLFSILRGRGYVNVGIFLGLLGFEVGRC